MPALCALKGIPKDQVLIVAGPTASGKSRLAFLGALQGEGVIINGDSIQVYEGLPLLTACPSRKEQEQVPHRVYEIFPYFHQGFSVEKWHASTQDVLQETFHQGKQPWVVGGTGFYLKALEQGLSPIPEITHGAKVQFRKAHDSFSFEELSQRLREVDPILAEKIKDKQRAIYALMVFEATGKPLSYWHTHKPRRSCYCFYRILVWPSMAQLMDRAAQRWHSMIAQGVLEEVQTFCSQQGWQSSPLGRALGLAELVGVLKGDLSLSDASTLYLQSIRAYIKRQRTWFRRQFSPHLVIPHGISF